MTRIRDARAGRITEDMEQVALREGVDLAGLVEGIASGCTVILRNRLRQLPYGVGVGPHLRTKVNALIGASSQCHDLSTEAVKVRTAVEAGADTLMDLSTGGDMDGLRRQTLVVAPVPVGTVPLYQVAVEVTERRGTLLAMTADDLFEMIEQQAQDGVDFMALHCGMTLSVIERLQRQGRVTDLVSRGGAFLAAWIVHNERENPLYEQFDRLLDILQKYDVTLSLSDGIRPGCIADSLDAAQVQGLVVVGEMAKRAWEAGVQVMVEGPGHVPPTHIAATVALEKRLCHDAPYFLLGPLPTDVGVGHDHITAAIGAALATAAGADIICYVTPAEHLGLPTSDDVREGLGATRIGTQAGDLARYFPGAWNRERALAHGAAALFLPDLPSEWRVESRASQARQLLSRYLETEDAR